MRQASIMKSMTVLNQILLIENVTAGADVCKAAGADVIVAVGGGSPTDTSKRGDCYYYYEP